MSASRPEPLGQLLMIGLGVERWTRATERFLQAVCPGGILISARRLREPESTAELLRKIWLALPVPPFLALEEEGGAVDPLEAFFPRLPSPRAAARQGSAGAARLGELAGAALRFLGFNTNLAPLLALSTPSSKNHLSTRAFSADPHEVARCAAAFVQGLESKRILPCAKYFPSLPDETVRRRTELPVMRKTLAELWREDLVPYRALVRRLPLVLVGHSAYKSLDYDLPLPASLSQNVVEGLLRVKLGYDGVALADNLGADEIRRTAELGEAAVRSVVAGCDLLLLCDLERSVRQALAGLKRGIETGKLSSHRLEQAMARLSRAKKRLKPPSGKISTRAHLELARRFEDFSGRCRPPEQKIA